MYFCSIASFLYTIILAEGFLITYNTSWVMTMIKELGSFYLCNDNDFILSRCKQVNALLSNAYWVKDRDDETMLRAMSNSINYAVLESETQRLVGYARVITDFATMYYLCDVFIDESFRGMGLGTALVEYIISDERLKALSGTLKTRDAQALYQKFGFMESDVSCMLRIGSDG